MPFTCLPLVVINRLYLFGYTWLPSCFVHFGISTAAFHDEPTHSILLRDPTCQFCMLSQSNQDLSARFESALHEIPLCSQQCSKMYLPIREAIVKVYCKVLENFKNLKK